MVCDWRWQAPSHKVTSDLTAFWQEENTSCAFCSPPHALYRYIFIFIYIYIYKIKCVYEHTHIYMYTLLPTNCSEQSQALFQWTIRTDWRKGNQELTVPAFMYFYLKILAAMLPWWNFAAEYFWGEFFIRNLRWKWLVSERNLLALLGWAYPNRCVDLSFIFKQIPAHLPRIWSEHQKKTYLPSHRASQSIQTVASWPHYSPWKGGQHKGRFTSWGPTHASLRCFCFYYQNNPLTC